MPDVSATGRGTLLKSDTAGRDQSRRRGVSARRDFPRLAEAPRCVFAASSRGEFCTETYGECDEVNLSKSELVRSLNEHSSE